MGYLEEEFLRVEGDPRYSVADVRSGLSWKLTWEGRWRQQIMEQVRNSRAQAKDKRDALYAQVRDVQRSLDADKAEADAGEIPSTELMTRRRIHLNRIGEFERRYEALENGEELTDNMASDPVAFKDQFYERWAPLRDKRPSIDAWIDDDRQKRQRR